MATPEGARKLISPGYLPDGIGLKDPSRMVKDEVEKIFKLWIRGQKEGKLPLKFKAKEVKQQLEEAQRLRIQSLKRKQPDYVDTDGDEDADGREGNSDNGKAGGKKSLKRKQPDYVDTDGDEDGDEQEGDGGNGKAGGKKQKVVKPAPPGGKKAKNPAKKAKNQSASLPAVESDPGRPKPRPLQKSPKAEVRKTTLLQLSDFQPYRSLVLDTLGLCSVREITFQWHFSDINSVYRNCWT
jgi:hypothetical protein